MITEDYCSYEVSKLLKEKGFDRACPYWYDKEKNMKIFPGLVSTNTSNRAISCPTYQMAMKWLRETYHLHIQISQVIGMNGNTAYVPSAWQNGVYVKTIGDVYDPKKTNEEAVEDALKYVLQNLVK